MSGTRKPADMNGYRVCVHPVDIADLRARVEKALAHYLLDQRTLLMTIDPALQPVVDIIERFVLRGGKRLRPAFAYWGYRGAGGEDDDSVVTATAALEFVQASALIHDDLMDASDTRRGEPSVHRQFERIHTDSGWAGEATAFGEGTAILLGDLCLTWSDELLHRCGLAAQQIDPARRVFDLMRTEVIAGQYLDVHAQATADRSLHRASTVARFKSAKYTVERPLLFGAALAGADEAITATYSAYGLPLGEAFQLRDDVLGVFGEPAQTGKPAGDDLREGKQTYLVASAFAMADEPTAARLQAGLGNPTLDSDGVAELREIIVGTGALAQTEARIDSLTDAALQALASVELAGEATKVLTALADVATRRNV
jgi:geranylgeranyl diphosphate synthase type I